MSLDGNELYVTGGGETGILRRYLIANGRPKIMDDLLTGLTVPDGMTVDRNGNIYVTEHTAKRVRVFTPQGEHVASILTDENVTNATFGGASGDTLFLTGTGAIWKANLSN